MRYPWPASLSCHTQDWLVGLFIRTNRREIVMSVLKEQAETIAQLDRIIEIFVASEGQIRPSFFLTGPSGAGKTHAVEMLAAKHDLHYMDINAAQLTKEGTSGNSLSKALSPLANVQGLAICMVDEFDKLFISGNTNSSLAHEVTMGVQNEFLKVLESKHASVYGDYGKYLNVRVDNVLFIFAGAFNGQENLTVDDLRSFGVKTEFLGRVGLLYNLEKPSLESLKAVLENSELLLNYLQLFPQLNFKSAVKDISARLAEAYEKNTLGVRAINNLIHQYFINGGKMTKAQAKKVTFQKTISVH